MENTKTTVEDLPDWDHRWIQEIINDLFIPYTAYSSRYKNYKSLDKNGATISGTIENAV